MPTTAQQVNTLLYHLTSKQPPPFPILFWSALQKIDFDYSAASIKKISQLFAQLGKRGIDLPKILSQQGGANFLLAITSYLAKLLSVETGEPITWYNFAEICQDIAEQNRKHHTQFELPKELGSSLVAKIGDVYCQPLKLLPSLLVGEPVLPDFIQDMQQAIFAKNSVNLLDDANTVAKNYLAKLQTGKLLDKSIGFYPYLAEIAFDFSQDSLHAIDTALARIVNEYQFQQADYARIVSEPTNQACFYLLGFYIGATGSQLANVASKWADFDEVSAMLGAEFTNCIEQRFVQLMQNHYRTPILVVTNRLFGIAPNFPNTAVAFAEIIDKQNRAELQIFLPKTLQNQVFVTSLPAIYQQAMHTAGQLLYDQLTQLMAQQPIVPKLIQVDSQSQQMVSLSSMDNDTALDKLYQQLSRDEVGLRYQVASFGLLTNLPLGQFAAIAVEIRINQTAEAERLALQLLLPYRLADDSDLPIAERLVLYPLISNQPNLPTLAQQLVYQLYQAIPVKLWQACGVEQLTPWQLSPLQQAKQRHYEQQQQQRVDTIDLPLLPLVATSPSSTLLTQGLALTLPPFDYEQVVWRGYDLPKYILDTPDNQREYLQVVVPDALIGDALFSQAENLQRFYRYGKVVWGIVVHADAELYEYDTTLSDTLVSEQMLTADILYDPIGQASVDDLQAAAAQLQAMLEQPIDSLPPDQSIYALHIKDPRSRVFGIDYPNSLQADPSKNRLKLSRSWVWRLHLPNGMLAKNEINLVPIMLEPDTPNQPSNAKGRVMILPARFWASALYQHWLIQHPMPTLEKNGDLLPKIEWQERQGYRYVGKGLDARLFPKFKINTAKASLTQSPTKQATKTNPTNPTVPVSAEQVHATSQPITHSTPQTLPQPSLVQTTPSQPQPTVATSLPSDKLSSDKLPSDKLAGLTPELQQQLLRDQARLQAELSTSDSDKEKKLYMIVGVMVALIIVGMLLATFLKK